VYDVGIDAVPSHWALAYEVPGRAAPWRSSNLRVYYVGAHPFMTPIVTETAACRQEGLREVRYTAGFDSAQASATAVTIVPEIDNGTSAAAHMEWRATFRADDDIYTFETMSDDGSWIYLNDELVLNNGGTHPARSARNVLRLGRGWYAFRLRYENVGGDQFLRFRIYRGAPATPVTPLTFCVEPPAGQGAAQVAR
jgi:hypothetical protein